VNNDRYYVFSSGSPYLPEEPVWIYTAADPGDFYSPKVSGAQRLPNGNTLICVGDSGIFFEVTAEKVTIWNYVNTYPNLKSNNVFNIHKYGVDYPGLSFLFQHPPDIPSTPNGPSSGVSGTKYSYTTSTSDSNEDQVYYLFDWDDGSTSNWIGPYDSGQVVSVAHVWELKGNFEIKVKAKDTDGAQSDWSDPLPITMPKIKQLSFIERLSDIFPLFHQILNLIIENSKMIYLE
jgi:hypothetical protein